MDLPTYIAYAEWWAEYPPLWMVPKALLSAGDEDEDDEQDAPRDRRFPSRPGDEHSWAQPPRHERPQRESGRRKGGRAQEFVGLLAGQGATTQRVPKDYFAKRVAAMDKASSSYRPWEERTH